MNAVTKSRPGHWAHRPADFAPRRLQQIDDGPRAARIASIEGQLDELREYARIYPDARNCVEEQREELRADLRALRQAGKPRSAFAPIVALVLIPLLCTLVVALLARMSSIINF